MKELVSVVIPTYNHAHFIGRALQSVMDQTHTEWEAIVVDNHSTDDTDAVLATFTDPRIRVRKIHNNGVIAASRNMGMRESRGSWIAFLDSDDCWYPAKLDALLKAAGSHDTYDVVSNDEMLVDEAGGRRTPLRYGPYVRDFYRVMLVEGNRLSPSATMVRRSFLAAHDIWFDESPEFATVEDYDFWLDLARAGGRFQFIHDVLGEFTVHATNSSAQLDRHLRNGELLLRHHVFNVQQFESPQRLWKQVLPRLRYSEARRLLVGGQRAAGAGLALRTLATVPGGSLAWVAVKMKRVMRRLGT